MPRIMEIEDGIARIIDRSVVAETPVDRLEKFLLTPQPLFIPVLPKNTVSISINPSTNIARILTELPPAKRTLILATEDTEPLAGDGDAWQEAYENGQNTLSIRTNMPYLYFIWTMSIEAGWDEPYLHFTKLFWRPSRISNVDQRLWPAAFPNVADNAEICWGGVDFLGQGFAKIDSAANAFFGGSVCNMDYGWRIPRKYGSFTDWVNDEDPTSFVNWPEWDMDSHQLTDEMETTDLDIVKPTAINFPPDIITFAGLRNWFNNNLTDNTRIRFARALATPIQNLIGTPDAS